MTHEIVLRSHWRYLLADSRYRVVESVYIKNLAISRQKREQRMSETTQCIICSKPLGQESIDLGYTLCHTHRACASCNGDVLPREAAFCIERELPIKHARCMSVKDGATLQTQIDIANIARLLTETTLRVSEMSFEQKYVYLRTLQENAAQVSLLVNRDKKSLNAQLASEKESKAAKSVKVQKEANEVKGTPTARRHLTDAAKAINALTKNGVTYVDAAKLILHQETSKVKDASKARMTILAAMESLGTPKEDCEATLDGRLN